MENTKLADKSKDYLRNGWRLLAATSIGGMRMDRISTEDVNALSFPGNAYNINCALKTLRRMLNLAREWELITKVPKIKLAKEIGRSLLLNEEAERKLLPFCGPLLRDIIGFAARHRDATEERTISNANRKSGLEYSGHFCSRQQDSDWTSLHSHE